MRAFDWSCVAVVCAAIGVAAACGGRMQVAECGSGAVYCEATDVCCPEGTVCGTGVNGCPARGCCTSSSLDASVDAGGGASTPPPEQSLTTDPPPPASGPSSPGGGAPKHPSAQ